VKPEVTPIGELLAAYERHIAKRDLAKQGQIMSILRRGLAPHMKRPIGSLSRLDYIAVMQDFEARGNPGAAEEFRARCATFLNFCANSGHLPASPLAGYRRPHQSRAERLSRRRLVFTGAERLRALWEALGAAHDPAFRDMLRFALLTGQRRGEVANMRWADLDFDHEDGPRWVIPESLRKTGESHIAPLGPLSAALLRSQPRHANTDLVFPSHKTGRTIEGWTSRLPPVREALGEPTLALHALRRSYRSALSDLGIDTDTAERQIGHKRPGLLGVYDFSDIWQRRIDAQQRYEAHLSEITGCKPEDAPWH
jgi:integrase